MINEKELLEQAKKDGVKRIVVGAIIKNKNRFLLLKRKKDDYLGGLVEFPSGGVEEKETLEQALIREIKEETGLTVTRIGDYVNSFDYDSLSGKRSRQFNFLTETKNGTIILSEHDEFYWVEKGDIEKFNISDNVKKIIRDNCI